MDCELRIQTARKKKRKETIQDKHTFVLDSEKSDEGSIQSMPQ